MKSDSYIFPDENMDLSTLTHIAITGDTKMADLFVKLLHYDLDYLYAPERKVVEKTVSSSVSANNLNKGEFFHPTPQGFVFIGYTAPELISGAPLIDNVCENLATLKGIKVPAAIHFGLQDAERAQRAIRQVLSVSPVVVESPTQAVLSLGRILHLPVRKLAEPIDQLAKDAPPSFLHVNGKWPMVRSALAALPPATLDCDPLSVCLLLDNYAQLSAIKLAAPQHINVRDARQQVTGSHTPKRQTNDASSGMGAFARRWFMPARATALTSS